MLVCDLADLSDADLGTLEAIAWLRLAARRGGWQLVLSHAPAELAELAALCGLDGALGLQAGRQPEHREEAGGIQEEGDAADPIPPGLDDLE